MKFVKRILSLLVALAISVSCCAHVYATTSADSSIDVQLMSFGSESERLATRTVIREGTTNYNGSYQYLTTEDGVNCVKLLYLPYGSFGSYRFTPMFSEAGMVDTDHKYVRVTYKTNATTPYTVQWYNSANGNQQMTVIEDTSVSNGEWVTSEPIDISSSGLLDVFTQANRDILFSFNCYEEDVEFYVKELAFFETEDDAYGYYGDEKDTSLLRYRVLSYGLGGNAVQKYSPSGYTNGHVVFDDVLGTATIDYSSTKVGNSNYWIDLQYLLGHNYTSAYKFMRILYSADNPAGVDSVSMTLYNNANGNDNTVVLSNLTDTDGFVLSQAVELSDTLATRFAGTNSNRLTFDTTSEGGKYQIKAVYFFKSAEDAASVSFNSNHTVTINGIDISEFSIVIPQDYNEKNYDLAQIIRNQIYELSGDLLTIYTDDTEARNYEILIGMTNRSESLSFYGANGIYNPNSTRYDLDGYRGEIVNNKLVFASSLKPGLENIVCTYLKTYFYKHCVSIPDTVALTNESAISGTYPQIDTYTWEEAVNVTNPTQYVDSFDNDSGFWREESGEDNWSIEYNTNIDYKQLFFNSEIAHTEEVTTSETVDYVSITYGDLFCGANYKVGLAYSGEHDYTTAYKYMRVLYSAQNPEGVNSVGITLYNNANGADYATVAANAVNTEGFVLSDTIALSDTLCNRFAEGRTNTLTFNATAEGATYKVKAVYFYETEEAANAATVGSSSASELNNYDSVLTCSSVIETTEEVTTNESVDYVTVPYGDVFCGVNYKLGLAFDGTQNYNADYKYMRLLYSANNPDGVNSISMTLYNNANGADNVVVAFNAVSTDGFALTDTVELSDSLCSRFAQGLTNTLTFNSTVDGGEYRVMGVYFFNTEESADGVQLTTGEVNNYRALLSFDDNGYGDSDGLSLDSENAAIISYGSKFANSNYSIGLKYLNGSNYSTAFKFMRVLYAAENPAENTGTISMHLYNNSNGNDYVTISTDISDTNGYVLSEPVELTEGLCNRFASPGYANTLTFDTTLIGGEYKVKAVYFYETQQAADNASYGNQGIVLGNNGVYSSVKNNSSVSYLHVYEQNVSFDADMKCAAKDSNASMGLLFRYTSQDAFVKVGYDFDQGEWYIESREGSDFECYRLITKEAAVEIGTTYHLSAEIDSKSVTLYVDGVEMISTNIVTQMSPGRIGIYANNAEIVVDNADVKLLSGLSQILPNVTHSVIPSDTYMEGGSTWELSDGSLVYEHYNGTTYKSTDDGKTWNESSQWTSFNTYPNVFRLANGNFLKISEATIENVRYVVSYISANDGDTWTQNGIVCTKIHEDLLDPAGNMNDKITQMSDGRIFYVQNYEGTNGVYCEIFYSDNNGQTWTKSQMNTREISGNESQTKFGECKVMETADGKLRLYCSWNQYGNIVYSESSDNGVTWGPITELSAFKSSRSSMQFVKDEYAANETTYYMVWVFNEPWEDFDGLPRSRLALAKTTDGVNWSYLGDVWRWETNYTKADNHFAQIVDPFIQVTEDYVIVGSGISEEMAETTNQSHQEQRQHIWSIQKSSLTPYEVFPSAR